MRSARAAPKKFDRKPRHRFLFWIELPFLLLIVLITLLAEKLSGDKSQLDGKQVFKDVKKKVNVQ